MVFETTDSANESELAEAREDPIKRVTQHLVGHDCFMSGTVAHDGGRQNMYPAACAYLNLSCSCYLPTVPPTCAAIARTPCPLTPPRRYRCRLPPWR